MLTIDVAIDSRERNSQLAAQARIYIPLLMMSEADFDPVDDFG